MQTQFGIPTGNRYWEVNPFSYPFCEVNDEFAGSISKVNFFLRTLCARSEDLDSPSFTGLKVHLAFEKTMEKCDNFYNAEPGTLVLPITRYGIGDDFVVSSREKVAVYRGFNTAGEDNKIISPELEIFFWEQFFECISEINIPAPDGSSLALGILRGGCFNGEEKGYLLNKAGISSTDPEPDLINLKPNVLFIGNSQMRLLAEDFQKIKGVSKENVAHINCGKAPLSNHVLPDVMLGVTSKKFDPKNTICFLNSMGNSFLRNEFGGVSFSKGHVLHRSGVAHENDFFGTLETEISISSALVGKGYQVVQLGPYPRYFFTCCNDPEHFSADYSPSDFAERIRDFNTYASRYCKSKQMQGELGQGYLGFINAETIFSAKLWGYESVDKDNVHLSQSNQKVLVHTVNKIVDSVFSGSGIDEWKEKYCLNPDIKFGDWLTSFRAKNANILPKIDIPAKKPFVPNPKKRQASFSHRGNDHKRGGFRRN